MQPFKSKLLFGLVALLLVGGFVFSYYQDQHTKTPKLVCLTDSQRAVYEEESKSISVVDDSGKVFESFTVEDIAGGGYVVQPRECWVFITKELGFDHKSGTPTTQYRKELWRYNYSGQGEFFMVLFEVDPNNAKQLRRPFYSSVLVDNGAKRIAAIRNYYRDKDFAIVIKSLIDSEDNLVILYENLISGYNNISGDLDFIAWSSDDRYIWGTVFIGAQTMALYRVDIVDGDYDIFIPPVMVLGGDALNTNTGWITYNTGAYWSGDLEDTNQERGRRLREGRTAELHVYNLLTSEDKLVDSTKDDSLWWFKPRWISDAELEYELPSGETKIYKL